MSPLSASRPLRAAVVLLALGPALSAAEPAGAAGKLGLPTGRVSYQLSGPAVSGTGILSWIEGGKRSRQDMKIRVTPRPDKPPVSVTSWTINDGTFIYMHAVSMGKKVMRRKVSASAREAASAGLPFTPTSISQGKAIGKGTVLGKPCEIRALGPAKLWVWKGLPLRIESTSGPQGNTTAVATRIETAPQLTAAAFRLPSGYQVMDVPHAKGRPNRSADGRKRSPH